MSRRALLAVVVAAFHTSPALATPEPAILLAVEDVHHPVLPLLRAELATAGFAVLSSGPLGSPQRLDDEARVRGAVAGIALTSSGEEIEVCVVDRVTGKIAFRELVTGDRNQGPWAEAVSVRIVELLRAAMIEIVLPHPPRGPVLPPPEVKAFVAAERPHLAVAVAPAVESAFGGLGVSPHLRLAAAYLWTPTVRWGVEASLPLAHASVSAPEGRAYVTVTRGGAYAELDLSTRPAKLQTFAGAGVFAGVLTMSGADARQPYQTTTARVPFAAAEARAGLRLEVLRNVAVTAMLACGFSFPGVAVLFQDRQVASWGRPYLSGAAGLQWVVF